MENSSGAGSAPDPNWPAAGPAPDPGPYGSASPGGWEVLDSSSSGTPAVPVTLGYPGLDPVLPEPPRRRGRRPAVLVAVAAVVTATIVGGGGLAYTVLSGGGDQPEQHLPADSVAFAKVDLDPSASQKIDAIRFLTKLPQVEGVEEGTDLRRWVFEQWVEPAADGGVGWKDVEPWLGDRAGLALVKGDGDAPVAPVLALQVSDEGAATSTLKRMSTDVGVVVSDGWAVIAQDQASADEAVAATKRQSLAEQRDFAADLGGLGEDGIAAVWADGRRLGEAASTLGGLPGGQGAPTALQDLNSHGAAVLRFDGPQLELAAHYVGGDESPKPPEGADTRVTELPDDTLVAAGAVGMGTALKNQWNKITEQFGELAGAEEADLNDTLRQATGLNWPDDVAALTSDHLTVAMGPPSADGTASVAVRGAGDPDADTDALLDSLIAALSGDGLDPDGALDPSAPALGLELQRGKAGSDWVLASTREQADAMSSGGDLGNSKAFRFVVRDLKPTDTVLFADLAGIADAYGDQLDAETVQTLKAMGAVGVVGRPEGGREGSVTLRLGTP